MTRPSLGDRVPGNPLGPKRGTEIRPGMSRFDFATFLKSKDACKKRESPFPETRFPRTYFRGNCLPPLPENGLGATKFPGGIPEGPKTPRDISRIIKIASGEPPKRQEIGTQRRKRVRSPPFPADGQTPNPHLKKSITQKEGAEGASYDSWRLLATWSSQAAHDPKSSFF